MNCCAARRRTFIILSGVGLALSIIGLIIVIVLFVLSNHIDNMYSIVLDAGSSSTKLSLYEWPDHPYRTNGEVKQVAEEKSKNGISDYIDKPFEAFASFSSNLNTLEKAKPGLQKSKVPVYLGATAGMRLQFILNPLGSLDLFDILRRNLVDAGYNVKTPNERIRLLSGAEEGLYGWISVNYVLGLITPNKQTDPLQTVGSLDLGGASTQISFVPSTKPTTPQTSASYYPLELFGKKYEVYSHSFLCYGKNEFENRILATLLKTAIASPVDHPCFLKTYESAEQQIDPIFSSPCVTGPYATKVFGESLTKPTGLTTFKIRGTGDDAACKKLIGDRFSTATCNFPSCSFNDIYQPAVNGQFRAYSGFSFVMQYLFPTKVTGFTKTEINTKVDEFCKRTWTDVAKEPNSQFAVKYCFDGNFLLRLLEGYGFKTDNDWKSITFGAKINGNSISWALGYMLEESGNLPSESPKIDMSQPLFIALAVIFSLLLIASIVGLVLACRARRDTDEYSS